MPVLGLTGGIATGKSSLTESLRRLMGATIFDADGCAHELLANDPQIAYAVQKRFGDESCDASGVPDRVKLRGIVFNQIEKRRELEAILHPVIRRKWLSLASQYAGGDSWLIVDLPLLFEVQAESNVDRTVVVACAQSVQMRRLTEIRHLEKVFAHKIIESQLDLTEKINRTHHVIWNDSTLCCLERQSQLLAHWLAQYAR
ncbi:MAG: dephospho-CoA kinase [Verrucomicrobiota bacterium]